MRIDHINIAAPRNLLVKVRDFYCTALQLEDGPRPDFGVPGYWLYGDGKPILHLIESNNHHAPGKPYYLDHVAFQVKDLKSYTERLDQLKVEYTVNHIAEFNISQVFCHDPCGIGVEANFSSEAPEDTR
jgi:catechol 2,3-dioxygenase-like lactoylglutathione lyase family enzyme